MRAYLSLGSNLGDRAAALAQAVQRLGEALRVLRVSPVYETEPQGYREQPWFLNCAVEVETDRDPWALLELALGVERAMGRERGIRWGPRTIDVDILLCEGVVVATPELTLPHPRLAERAFMLVPLADLAPGLEIPGWGPVAALAAARRGEPGQAVRPWGALPVEGLDGSGAGDSARARILERLLAAGGARVSGEALRAELGISRAAVWKHVQALRAAGYPIEGVTGGGYRLPPDEEDAVLPLAPERLVRPGRRVGARDRLVVLRRVDSTNTWAKRLAQAGCPAGTAVVAEEQEAGRGRNGRGFLSPRGGVYVSVVLRPRVPPAAAVRLTLAGAVAVAEAVEAVSALRPTIKWPNDVLLPGGKVAGVLLELAAAEDAVDFVVLGMGVNVSRVPGAPGATSLWAEGARVPRAEVARALLDAVERVAEACERGRWPEVLAGWRRRSATLGRDVVVEELGGRRLEGRAVDVTEDGALLVATASGLQTVLAGDVLHVRPAEQGAS
jgi:BirA family biotin operon repressor/biotin-[acetyl-CoA-carboxylase] ligase